MNLPKVLASLIFTVFPAWCLASELPKSVPPAWREEVFADTSNNIFIWNDMIQDVAARKVVPVYVFEVPIEDVTTVHSEFLGAEELAEFYLTKKRKKFLKTYVPESDNFKNAIAKLKRKYGEPSQTLAGVKIQGKATFHVWDPSQGDEAAFRLKLPYYGKSSEGNLIHHNDFGCSKAAIQMNDYLTKIEQQSPIAEGTFYREVFAAEVKGLGTKFDFLIRRPPPTAFKRSPTQSFLPLHGLLNSTHIMELASVTNKTPVEWINDEYLPKLAAFIAKLNVEWGLFTEAHSQNLSVLVDRSTGEINGFYFKDLYDVMVSPYIQAARGILPIYTERPQAVLMENWITSNADDEFPGPFAFDYLLQSVAGWTNDKKASRMAVANFLENYKSGFLGSNSSLANRHYLKQLKKGLKPMVEYHFNPRSTVMRSWLSDYEAAFIHFMNDLFDWAIAAKTLAANYPHATDSRIPPETEKKLAELAHRQFDRELISWSFRAGKSYYEQYLREKHALRVMPIRNGIVISAESNFVLGVAYGFTGEELNFINEQAKAAGLWEPQRGSACEAVLSGSVPEFNFKPLPKNSDSLSRKRS